MNAEVFTLREINSEADQPIPLDRFELVGCRLIENPEPVDLQVSADDLSLSLVLNSSGTTGRSLVLVDFDEKLPVQCISDNFAVSVRSLVKADISSLISQALDLLVKRVVRIRIKRTLSSDEHVRITLYINGFETQAICNMYELAGFLSDPDPEMEGELAAREAREFNKFQ